jgi:hypothetical protein
MQGRRQKIKKRLLLAGLSFLVIAALTYAKRDRIFGEFRQFIQNTISQQLRIQVEVGGFESGFLRRISFRDLSISDKSGNFRLLAKGVRFNFWVWDVLFKRYRNFNHLSLVAEDVDFFRQNSRLPLNISAATVYFADGVLRIEHLRGALNGKIPFEITAEIEHFLEASPRMEISCRFFSPPAQKIIPVSLPALIYLKGDLNNLILQGYWQEREKSFFDIEGQIQPLNRLFSFIILPREDSTDSFSHYVLEEGRKISSSSRILEHPSRIILTGDFSRPNHLNIKLSLEHLRVLNNDLLSNIFLENEFVAQENLMQGKIYSSGTVLNYQPLPEFNGFYKISGTTLRISSFKWAGFLLSGLINLDPELRGNLLMLINNFNLGNFVRIYYPQWDSWGLLQGRLALDINASQILSRGEFGFSEGLIGTFKFRGGRINIEGENSLLRLKDSRIYQENGYLDLSGEADLKRLGKPDFGKKLMMSQNSKDNMDWQGWNISRRPDREGVAFDKEIDEKLSVGFKAYMNNEVNIGNRDNPNEMDLEYRLKEDKRLKIRLKDNEELLGVEHKVKF